MESLERRLKRAKEDIARLETEVYDLKEKLATYENINNIPL